jgi:hypothetical protein
MSIPVLGRRTRLAGIAGVTTLLLLVGSTAAYALWSASGTAGSTATTASVGVAHALSSSTLAVSYSSTTTAAVGVVTVTNTGSRDGTYSVALSASSASSTLSPAVTVEIGVAASCTVGATLSSVVSGTFATTVTKSGAITAGASVVLCIRTSMTAASISTNPSTSLTATIASSVLIGTWTATASPALGFVQSVAASATLNSSAWYWIKKVGSPERCAEANNSGTVSGTAVTTGGCSLSSQAATNANEYWRFTPTSGGYYKIVNRNAQSLWWSVPSAAALQPLQISSATGTTNEWQVVDNGDGSYTFKLRANTALCAEGTGNGNGASLRVNTCSTSIEQRFAAVMYETVTPAPITLSCVADGLTANYSWPQLTGYQSEVSYRVLVGTTVDAVHTGATGTDTVARFAWGVTTAAYPVGTFTITVQQSVAGGSWTTTGTATLVRAAAAPYLSCS